MIKPLRDWLVVKPLENNDLASDSVIFISQTIDKIVDSQKQLGKCGVIVACGPGKYIKDKLIKLSVDIGDKIVYGQFKYQTTHHEGVVYELIQQADIIGIIGD